MHLILTLATLFWVLLLFIGAFFASNPVFPVIMLGIVALTFFLLHHFSTKIALILSILTLLVSILVIMSNYEEDYCWKQGQKADQTGSKTVIASQEDAVALKDFGVKPGAEIGTAFRAHMLCHDSFK